MYFRYIGTEDAESTKVLPSIGEKAANRLRKIGLSPRFMIGERHITSESDSYAVTNVPEDGAGGLLNTFYVYRQAYEATNFRDPTQDYSGEVFVRVLLEEDYGIEVAIVTAAVALDTYRDEIMREYPEWRTRYIDAPRVDHGFLPRELGSGEITHRRDNPGNYKVKYRGPNIDYESTLQWCDGWHNDYSEKYPYYRVELYDMNYAVDGTPIGGEISKVEDGLLNAHFWVSLSGNKNLDDSGRWVRFTSTLPYLWSSPTTVQPEPGHIVVSVRRPDTGSYTQMRVVSEEFTRRYLEWHKAKHGGEMLLVVNNGYTRRDNVYSHCRAPN